MLILKIGARDIEIPSLKVTLSMPSIRGETLSLIKGKVSRGRFLDWDSKSGDHDHYTNTSSECKGIDRKRFGRGAGCFFQSKRKDPAKMPKKAFENTSPSHPEAKTEGLQFGSMRGERTSIATKVIKGNVLVLVIRGSQILTLARRGSREKKKSTRGKKE